LSLYLGGKGSIKECIELARITLDNGKALQKLQQLIVLSNG
jgi:anthranilate phosphoribosyltransferase